MTDWFQIEPDCRAMLTAAGLADLDSWLALAAAATDQAAMPSPAVRNLRVAGRHTDRLTVSLDLSDRTGSEPPIRLFAKIHFAIPLWPMMVDMLACRGRPLSNPRTEWDWLHRLARLGFDTMAPVAAGERRRFGLPREAVLVSRAVPADKSLRQLLLDQPALADDQVLWAALGRFFARFRLHNLFFRDLTAKHIFPRRRTDAWDFFLIDVERTFAQSASPRRTAPPAGRWDVFFASLPCVPSARAVEAMTNGYRLALGDVRPADADALAAGITATLRRLPRRPSGWWASASPEMLALGPLTVNVLYRSALADTGLTSMESIFGFSAGEPLAKHGLSAHRRRDRIVLSDGRAIYLKRYQPGFWRRVQRVFRPGARASEAADEWHALWRLADAGVPVPEPVLFGQSSRGAAAARSCLALAEVPRAQSLEKWLPENGPSLSAARRELLIDRLADFVACFHYLGAVHRDLYLSHVFISWPDGDEPCFWLIDLARVFRPRWRRSRWLVKDLAQLRYSLGPMFTPAEWDRFLRRYLGPEGAQTDVDRLAGKVERKARAITRHADRRKRRAAPAGGR